MKYIKDVIVSKQEPPKNVMWLKPTESDTYELSFFGNNGWTKIGGETAEPTNANVLYLKDRDKTYFELNAYDLTHGTKIPKSIGSAIIGRYTDIGEEVIIGEHTSIGSNVKIPDGWDATLFKPGTSTSGDVIMSTGYVDSLGRNYLVFGSYVSDNIDDVPFAVPENFKIYVGTSLEDSGTIIITEGDLLYSSTRIQLGTRMSIPNMWITSDASGLMITTENGSLTLPWDN